MDSEIECLSENHEDFEESEIDKFIFKETDYIMDIYYDLKDRIPYFLDKLHFSDLLHFIIDIKFNLYKNKTIYNQKHINYFEDEYAQEIHCILYVLNNYLLKYKKFQIDYETFLLFSYNFTTII
jgi:hypothetical protein